MWKGIEKMNMRNPKSCKESIDILRGSKRQKKISRTKLLEAEIEKLKITPAWAEVYRLRKVLKEAEKWITEELCWGRHEDGNFRCQDCVERRELLDKIRKVLGEKGEFNG